MKPVILPVAFILILFQLQAQDIDYNHLTAAYKDAAAQALGKVSPATKKWFADMAMQQQGGSFNIVLAKAQLQTKFTAKDMQQVGDLFVIMMAYQRMLNQEAREDRKISMADKQASLNAKSAKLETDNAKIEQQKKEAAEKQAHAMDAATTQLATGVVSGSSQIAAGTNGTGKIDSLKNKQINPQYNKPIQIPANTAKADDQKKSAADHERSQRDNIQKILDQLAEIKRGSKIY
jgi:hypothetical protein